MKNTRFFALLLCFILLLTACGSKAPSEEMGMADNGFYSEEYDMVPGETSAAMDLTGDSALSAPILTDRKLIKTVSMNAETEHYDDLIPALDGKITALGGYVESRETGNYSRTRRWTRMTIRIPAEQLGDFVTHVGENANVLSTSEQTQDVTIQYADTEAKLTALRTEQTRLLELLSQAQNLGEILEIEARLRCDLRAGALRIPEAGLRQPHHLRHRHPPHPGGRGPDPRGGAHRMEAHQRRLPGFPGGCGRRPCGYFRVPAGPVPLSGDLGRGDLGHGHPGPEAAQEKTKI